MLEFDGLSLFEKLMNRNFGWYRTWSKKFSKN